MIRKFLIEERPGGPIANAVWSPVYGYKRCTMQEVERHCRDNQARWKSNLFRLTELKPMAVEFKTIVDMKEIV